MDAPSESGFLYLMTVGRKSGRFHRIEIWFVSFEGNYYIISELGEKADFVQNVKHNRKVQFTVENQTFDGWGRLVDSKESELCNRIMSLMYSKYGWSEGLIVELRPNR